MKFPLNVLSYTQLGNSIETTEVEIASRVFVYHSSPFKATRPNGFPTGGDGYQNGYSLYNGYFIPNSLDPYGTCKVELCKRDVNTAGKAVGVAAGIIAKHHFIKVTFKNGDLLSCCDGQLSDKDGDFVMETGLGEQGGGQPGEGANPFPLTQPVDHAGQSATSDCTPIAGPWDCCNLYKHMADRTPTGRRYPAFNCHDWAGRTIACGRPSPPPMPSQREMAEAAGPWAMGGW